MRDLDMELNANSVNTCADTRLSKVLELSRTGVGVADLSGFIGIHPDLALAALEHGGCETLFRDKPLACV